jgi:hypothetical protein
MVQDIIETNLTQRTTSSQEIREVRREINLWIAREKANPKAIQTSMANKMERLIFSIIICLGKGIVSRMRRF